MNYDVYSGKGPPTWPPPQQAPANGLASAPQQQQQQQSDMQTPAPLGTKRKFVASPPPEAVSPLFSTPGKRAPAWCMCGINQTWAAEHPRLQFYRLCCKSFCCKFI